MNARLWIGFVVASGCFALLLPVVSNAGDGPKAEELATAEKQDNYVKDLMMAYRLKELGTAHVPRGKGKVEYTSPESMVAAARLFFDLAATKVDELKVTPTIESEGGKGVDQVDKVDVPSDLKKEGDALLALAKKASQDQKLNLDAVLKNLEKISKRLDDEATRGAIGGPRNINRTLGGHDAHVYHIQFAAHIPATVGFQANIPIRVTVVRTGNDNVVAAGINTRGVCNWFPDTQKKGKAITGAPITYTIRVYNLSKTPAHYRLFTN